jgi:outer membrane lipoprotein-sorting protein
MIRLLKHFFVMLLLVPAFSASAQNSDATQLFYKVRNKLAGVKDYIADVKMQVDISFMRIPQLNGKLYFKAPDKVKLERNGGLAVLPKKNLSVSLSNLIPEGSITVIDAGSEVKNGRKLRILKVIPDNENANIVLAKIWVDEARLLAMRTETTTRDNGTVKMDLEYGRYATYALPDKMTVNIDVKEYKLPKGVTMDYDSNPQTPAAKKGNGGMPNKGRIQITYLSYKINTGLSDAIFVEKKK